MIRRTPTRHVRHVALVVSDGYRVLPHWHPRTERLTIVQGVVHLGTGDRFDAAATQAPRAGTYSAMPPRNAADDARTQR